MARIASKLVNYSRHSESLNIRKNSEIDDIFLRRQQIVNFQTYFKDSLCLKYLTNFGVKGDKRSIKMCTTNFYKSFFQKYFFVHEQSAVKNSFSTCVCYSPDGLFWLNLYLKLLDVFHNRFLTRNNEKVTESLHRMLNLFWTFLDYFLIFNVKVFSLFGKILSIFQIQFKIFQNMDVFKIC